MKHLFDKYGRRASYLRIAVTDRCNLRCTYCMPEEGIDFIGRKELMTYEEILRFAHLMVVNGVDKLRITGGEPFVRKDLVRFLFELKKITKGASLHITSNGTLLDRHMDQLVKLGLDSINLSLDTLDHQTFHQMTRRDSFDTVWSSYKALLNSPIKVKVNVVVQSRINSAEIPDFVQLTKTQDVSVRFIEEMPFNGSGKEQTGFIGFDSIFQKIYSVYPKIKQLPSTSSASGIEFQIPGFIGRIGIIPAWTRTMCGSCNRLRLTPLGRIKTCLYDDGVFNVKDFMRAGMDDQQLVSLVAEAISHKAKNGFEAQANKLLQFESMATIGG